MSPALLLALAAAAQPRLDPEAAIAAQRAELREALRLDCPPEELRENEALVCGRPRQSYRVTPLDGERRPDPTDPDSRAGGRQLDAMAAGGTACTTVGREQNCGGFDMLGAGIMVIREIIRGIERRQD
jgi:hypothetical protein